MTGLAASGDELEGARARVEERPDGMLVSMPPKRFVFALIFLPFWLVLWSAGWVTGADDPVFMVVGPIGSFVVLGIWLWMLFGREEVEIGGGRLVLRKRVGPVKREQGFDAAKVEELRALPVAGSSWFDNTGLTHHSMAFDVGARTHKFAGALDEAEAKHLARRLQERLR
jgi:hypothetical protein